ncbi:MAG: DUF2723 domain-containing protein, partial [Anaerolineae bacterium]|nr:DUF2723 domain-containing protein [Anaerolineae bacterium]
MHNARGDEGRAQPVQGADEVAPLTRMDLALGVAAFAVALALYVRTLYPGLLPGDSGEFQALARLLGTAHPTGYPVYLLLAHPISWLPLGSVAYRVNAMSALMGALTVGGVSLCARLVSGRRWTGLLAAIALSFSATLWSQAVIAEVYTTGTAFAVGVLLAVLYWDRTGRTWALGAAGLIGGLSLGGHLTVALLAPPVVIYLAVSRKASRRAWGAALLGAAVGVALALGAYLAMDLYPSPADFIEIAIVPSRSVWGLSEANLDTAWERVWCSLSGRQWQGRMFADPGETVPRNVGAYLDNLGNEFSLVYVALAALGIGRLWARQRPTAVLLLGVLLAQWAYAFGYDIHDVYVFHLCGYLAIAVLGAAGADAVAGLWTRRPAPRLRARAAQSALAAALCVAAVA